MICDNYSSNVSTFRKLLASCVKEPDDLFMEYHSRKIYLFYDTVHLVKNLRYNLLSRKRFIFPPFSFHGFKDNAIVSGGEISWKLFHDVFEKDVSWNANLRKAPKISQIVLHPGNNKQSVPLALAIFDETTIAAIQSYFPEKSSAAEFLKLFYKWWIISNSKNQFSSKYYLGNAAVIGDMKSSFLRSMTAWVQNWQDQRIPNSEQFTLTSQTLSAFIRTLNCHASLIEDLLNDGFQFVMTSRFQSDPIERRFR